jgi:hypothetical protein
VTFDPSTITFSVSDGGVQKFRINPSSSLGEGLHRITWTKVEATTTTRFSELPETTFQVVKTPDENSLKLTLSQTIYRNGVDSYRLPIYMYLSSPPSASLTVYLSTTKPVQAEYIDF